jgi:hypothetical protein
MLDREGRTDQRRCSSSAKASTARTRLLEPPTPVNDARAAALLGDRQWAFRSVGRPRPAGVLPHCEDPTVRAGAVPVRRGCPVNRWRAAACGKTLATVPLTVAAGADLAPPARMVWVGGAVGPARTLLLTPHRWPARMPRHAVALITGVVGADDLVVCAQRSARPQPAPGNARPYRVIRASRSSRLDRRTR